LIFNLELGSDDHMRPLSYILKDGKPVPADPQTVEAFLKDIENRRVDETLLYAPDGSEIRISTVFLCIDHGLLGDSPPVLWETMIFWEGRDDGLGDWQQRYTSEEAARAGHKAAVALVKATLDQV
jgi:hypothetical protein